MQSTAFAQVEQQAKAWIEASPKPQLQIKGWSMYAPAYPRLQEYLTTIGLQKLIKPLYEELMKTPEGKQRAKAIFAKARDGYHPIAQTSVGKIVNG